MGGAWGQEGKLGGLPRQSLQRLLHTPRAAKEGWCVVYRAPDCSRTQLCCALSLPSAPPTTTTTTTITTHTRWSPLRPLVAASATAAGAATGVGVAAGAAASGAGAAAAAAAVTAVIGRTVAAAAAAAVAPTSTSRTPLPSPPWVEGFRVVGCWRGLKPCGRGHGGSLFG